MRNLSTNHNRELSIRREWQCRGSAGLGWLAVMALSAGLLTEGALGQNLYWDLNGATAGSGGPSPTGTWDGGSLNWNANAAGTGPTAAWVAGSTAIFSAGSDATSPYTITLSGTQTAGGVTFNSGTPTLTGGILLLNSGAVLSVASGHTAVISSVLDGVGGWTISSSGTLRLSGANTIAGPLTLTGGKVQLDSDAAAGAGALIITPSVDVFVQNTASGTVLTNPITLNPSRNVDFSALGGSLTLNGSIGGTRTLWTIGGQGANTVVLGGSNYFNGNLELVSGTLIITHDKALGETSGTTKVDGGATLGIQGDITYTYAEPVSLFGDGVGSLGSLRNLGGNNVFFGPLNLQTSVTLGADTGSLELAGTIAGPGLNLTKVGPGRVIISGFGNNFNDTIVAGGVLQVDSSLGSGAVTVAAGTTLAGQGSIAGSIALSGTLSPADSPGAITTGPQTWNSGATYLWELNDADFGSPGAGVGLGWDVVDLSNGAGTLSITATPANRFTLTLRTLDPLLGTPAPAGDFDNTADYSFLIAHTTGGIAGFDPAAFVIDDTSFQNDKGLGEFVLATANAGNDLVLQFVHPPFVVTQPVSATKECGIDSVTFSVTAGGSSPLSYQWYYGATPVGGNSPSLTINPVSFADAGNYHVVVSNQYGSTVSTDASLAVQDTTKPVLTACPANLFVSAAGPTVLTYIAPAATDACEGSVAVVCSPPSGSEFPVGTTLVTCTATDSHGNSQSCTFYATVCASGQPAVFVDDDYAGKPNGTLVKFPAGGSGADHVIGCDAFATIQTGIAQVAAGGTVSVAPGAYFENLSVAKPLHLLGTAGATIIYPAFSDVGLPDPDQGPSFGGSQVIVVTANDVEIAHLVIDGNNPNLTSGVIRGGQDIDARNGIIEGDPGLYSGLEVHDCVVSNIYLRAIYARQPTATDGFYIHDNVVANVQGGPSTLAIFNFGGSGIISNNVVSDASDAIAANWSTGTKFLNNTVTRSGSGVHSDNNGGSGGSADLLQGNTVRDGRPGAYGVWLFAPYVAGRVEANTISNVAIGLALAGQMASFVPVFTNNSVIGNMDPNGAGVYETSSLFGFGSANVAGVFGGNIISNTAAGFYLESETGYALTATAFDNSVSGSTADVVKHDLGGTFAIDASGNWWGVNTAAGVAALLPATGVDYSPWLDTGTDLSPERGFQGDFSALHVTAASLQSGPATLIQEAITLIADGLNVGSARKVSVEPGNYVGNLLIDRPLILAGPNFGLPGNASRGPEAIVRPADNDPDFGRVIDVAASGVTIDGLQIDGDGPNGIGRTVGGVDVNSSAGIQNGPFIDAPDYFVCQYDIDHLTVQNNVFQNFTWYGLYLGRPVGAANAFFAVQNNLFRNLPEGGQFYAVHVNFSQNTLASATRVVSMHQVTGAADSGFVPQIANNTLDVATDASVWDAREGTSSPRDTGIWVNGRNGSAPALAVAGNLINVTTIPAGKEYRGLTVWGVGGDRQLTLTGNVVNGNGAAQVGLYAWNLTSSTPVVLSGGSLNNLVQAGVRAVNNDTQWGPADTAITVNHVPMILGPGAAGVVADGPANPPNHVLVTVTGNTSMSGGAAGVLVAGPNAAASVLNNSASITGNAVGIDINGGKALLENNNLTANTIAAIRAQNGATVDAGDCLDRNMTGLGTGSRPGGSSAGGNALTGYLVGPAKAVLDLNTAGQPDVLAHNNNYGLSAGGLITAALSDLGPGSSRALATQLGGLNLTAPPAVTVQCVNQVPPGIQGSGVAAFDAFFAAGGKAWANDGALSFADDPITPGPYQGTITRHYSINACGNSASAAATITVQDTVSPTAMFHSISVQLDATGNYTFSASDLAAMSAGSTDNCAISSVNASPSTVHFCDVGSKSVTVSVADTAGNVATAAGNITVLAPAAAPLDVYVDAAYSGPCGLVTFPASGGTGAYYVGFNAFQTVQAGLDAVAANGRVHVAAGTYLEDLSVTNPVSLLGPNAGLAGTDPARGPEAILLPATADPEGGQVIYLAASGVTIDGFMFDSQNPVFTPAQAYGAGNAAVYSSAAIQNTYFWTTPFAQVDHVTIQNNVIRNMSYDGIYLELDLGRTNGFNYILNNKFDTMWEGLQTYAFHSVISNNTFVSANRGLSLHGTTVPASAGFTPGVVSNAFTIAEWWPTNIDRVYSMGIWINYRRDYAAPLDVVGNVVNTPAAAPAGKTIRGLYALTIDGHGKLNLINNTVNGDGNCQLGLFVAACWSNNAVQVLGGSFNNILSNGVLADTLDPVYGAGDAFVTVSNVAITLAAGGTGIQALQDATTLNNQARVTVLDNTAISGGASGISVQGAKAAATVLNNAASITGNQVGIHVSAGKALLEHNTLTNNVLAALLVENDALVDAGDCAGGNITGLGTGSGLNGSSAGLNDLSGYGFDSAAPWAIQNSGAVSVKAEDNLFGATPAESIATVVTGPVAYAQANGLLVACPPPIIVQCVGDIPAGATTLADYIALGGLASANPASVSYVDNPSNPTPGDQTVTRTYTVTDPCGQSTTCDQTITVHDTLPPTPVCPGDIVQAVDPGQNYATVSFSVSATDNCDPPPTVAANPPQGQFPEGTNLVTVTATDASGNQASCTFNVVVLGAPVFLTQPTNLTVNLGQPASFSVRVTGLPPLTYQWQKNGADITGATDSSYAIGSALAGDVASYRVMVSNPISTVPSQSAALSIIFPPTQLKLLSYSDQAQTLTMTGADGYRYAILGSSNLPSANWVYLVTNTAPYIFIDTNPALPYKFYRGQFVP